MHTVHDLRRCRCGHGRRRLRRARGYADISGKPGESFRPRFTDNARRPPSPAPLIRSSKSDRNCRSTPRLNVRRSDSTPPGRRPGRPPVCWLSNTTDRPCRVGPQHSQNTTSTASDLGTRTPRMPSRRPRDNLSHASPIAPYGAGGLVSKPEVAGASSALQRFSRSLVRASGRPSWGDEVECTARLPARITEGADHKPRPPGARRHRVGDGPHAAVPGNRPCPMVR
jgi:hypothetical protein